MVNKDVYCFRDKRRFASKIANFLPVYFGPHRRSSPENGYRRSESKNLNHGATGPRKKFDNIFSHMDTIHQHDRQTDGRRTDIGRQQRPRLRIASRGKNRSGVDRHTPEACVANIEISRLSRFLATIVPRFVIGGCTSQLYTSPNNND